MLNTIQNDYIPVYAYDKKLHNIVSKQHIICNGKLLVNDDYLVKMLNIHFGLSKSAVEYVIAVYWDKSFNPVGVSKISKGFTNVAFFEYTSIFRTGILCRASYLTLLHNHPENNLKWSSLDKKSTEQIRCIGIALDLQLRKHIIVGKDSYSIIEI